MGCQPVDHRSSWARPGPHVSGCGQAGRGRAGWCMRAGRRRERMHKVLHPPPPVQDRAVASDLSPARRHASLCRYPPLGWRVAWRLVWVQPVAVLLAGAGRRVPQRAVACEASQASRAGQTGAGGVHAWKGNVPATAQQGEGGCTLHRCALVHARRISFNQHLTSPPAPAGQRTGLRSQHSVYCVAAHLMQALFRLTPLFGLPVTSEDAPWLTISDERTQVLPQLLSLRADLAHQQRWSPWLSEQTQEDTTRPLSRCSADVTLIECAYMPCHPRGATLATSAGVVYAVFSSEVGERKYAIASDAQPLQAGQQAVVLVCMRWSSHMLLPARR